MLGGRLHGLRDSHGGVAGPRTPRPGGAGEAPRAPRATRRDPIRRRGVLGGWPNAADPGPLARPRSSSRRVLRSGERTVREVLTDPARGGGSWWWWEGEDSNLRRLRRRFYRSARHLLPRSRRVARDSVFARQARCRGRAGIHAQTRSAAVTGGTVAARRLGPVVVDELVEEQYPVMPQCSGMY